MVAGHNKLCHINQSAEQKERKKEREERKKTGEEEKSPFTTGRMKALSVRPRTLLYDVPPPPEPLPRAKETNHPGPS